MSTTPDVATARKRIETPQLARIFGEGGLVFDAAYAGYSVCGPSRTAILSGKHAGNMYGCPGCPPRAHQVGRADETGSSPQTPNLPSLMRAAGYVTGIFGKSDPLQANTVVAPRSGYDFFLGQPSQAQCHDLGTDERCTILYTPVRVV